MRAPKQSGPSLLYRNYGLRLQRRRLQPTKNHSVSRRRLGITAACLLIGIGCVTAAITHHAAMHVAVTPLKAKPASHIAKPAPTPTPTPPVTQPVATAPQIVQPADPASDCHDNTLSQLVIVSIAQRHMWACEQTTSVYDSPVVTGMDFLAADLTPTGTYHVYAKYTNQTLKGCDSTGCWGDPVSYWLPWLSNQYGIYGFHDATWRADSDFGTISPDSPSASHGCVELPLSTAAWLYNWAPIGLTLTVEA